MIRIENLELHNFLSHVDTNLDFNDYKGLVLIEGKNTAGQYSSNGSGKSTILEGIVYVLTGNTLRGVGVNDVVNRNYKKDTKVTLKFTKDDIVYEISRYRKDTAQGDNLVFIKNGEDISKRLNKDTQALIDDTLGISYKVLVSTILLGEGLSSRFTQLSDPEKKSLIESTLNLNYDMNVLKSTASTELNKLKLEKSNLDGKISVLDGYVDYDVESAEKEYKELYTKYETELSVYDVRSNAVKVTNDEIQKLSDKMSLIKSSIDKVDYLTNTLTTLDNQNSQLVSELTNAEKCDNPRCTVCHQELKDEEAHSAFVSNYKERINTILTQMTDIRTQLDNLPSKDTMVQAYDRMSSDLISLRSESSDLTEKANDTQRTIYELKSNIDMKDSEIKRYNEAKDSIDSLKSDLSTAESQMNIYDYFYKLFSPTGIVIDILSEAISYINDRISTYSEILLDKRYSIDFKKGKISLVDESGASYQSLSNGEKRRLDISIQMSLHDYVTKYCGMEMSCVFLDEVLDTLDEVGIENIFELLRLKLDYCGLSGAYVITHNDTLKDKFDQIITVSKDSNGDSRIY